MAGAMTLRELLDKATPRPWSVLVGSGSTLYVECASPKRMVNNAILTEALANSAEDWLALYEAAKCARGMCWGANDYPDNAMCDPTGECGCNLCGVLDRLKPRVEGSDDTLR